MGIISRREALMRLGAIMGAGAGLAAGNGLLAGMTTPTAAMGNLPVPDANGDLNIVHITDVHLFGKRKAEKWFAKCLHSIQSHESKPSLIINTGDSIMDSARASREDTDAQWKLWNDVLTRENSLPIRHCLGNHDVWAIFDENRESIEKSDPMFGHARGKAGFGLDQLYYSFDVGNWHFVMLDSVRLVDTVPDRRWIGLLDEEQFQWLEKDLEATPKDKHVMVASHMPILQVCSMMNLEPDDMDFSYRMPASAMMGDSRRLLNLFRKHPNVKLCVSGHTHQLDRIELQGVNYICGGAVSGRKWREMPVDSVAPLPGYNAITLKADGTFTHQYENYGWKI